MSSKAGLEFGAEHHEKYAKVLDKWSNKNISEVTDKTAEKWGADLLDALGDPVIESLSSKEALGQWKKAGVKLPSKETIKMFSEIAAKYSLGHASPDLLRRLVLSVKNNKENPVVLTAAAEGKIVRPSELIKRSPQTVAQLFDMAKDKFNDVMSRYLKKDAQFTGKKRWVTVGNHSRHADLDKEVRDEGGTFTYKKKSIGGPRPVGGNPGDWSNCSCRLEYQKSNGKWVSITD